MQSEQPKYQIGMTVSACLWLGLFPLLQGGTYTQITYDKWNIMQIMTGVTLLCFCIDLFCMISAQRRGRGSPLTGFLSPLSAFRTSLPLIVGSSLMLWTILSCRLSTYNEHFWWLGETSRYEALASQLCYFAVFAFFFFSRVSMKPVLLSAAAGVAVFFVIVLLQRAGSNPLGLYPSGRSYAQNPEFQGTIGNIDMGTGYLLLLSGLFLFTIINALSSGKSGRKSADDTASETPRASSRSPFQVCYLIILSAALLISLYLILTMDVQFGVVSLAVLALYVLLRFLPKKLRLPCLIFIIVLVLLVVWFWPGQSGGIWELHEIFHGRVRLSFGSNRLAAWFFSLRLAGENLVFGGGSGTFNWRFNQFLSDNYLSIPTEQDGKALPDYFDNPHNEYVQQLTDHGIPGLLLYLVFLLLALFRRRDGWFPLLAPCSAAVLCYIVQAFFSFSVCIVAPMFWMLLGMSYSEQ